MCMSQKILIIVVLSSAGVLSGCGAGDGGGGGTATPSIAFALDATALTISGPVPAVAEGTSVSVTVNDQAALIVGSTWSHQVTTGTHTVRLYVNGNLETTKNCIIE